MITIEMNGPKAVIGRKGENEAVRLSFDVKNWLKDYPTADIVVMCKRPADENAYPVPSAQISIDDGTLYWILSNGDLEYEGTGECELILIDGNTIAKDVIYTIQIARSLDGGAEPPDPWTGWVEQVAADAERAEQAASEAQRIVSEYGLKPTKISGNNYKMGFEEVEDNG